MTPDDKSEFCKVVLGFAELKGKSLSLPAVELYWHAMQEWSLDEFRQAAAHLLKTAQFMPVPKDFEDLRKAGRETAGEAWLSVRRYLQWGINGYTLAGDCPPLLAKCIRAVGGANTIAMCDEDKLHFLERRFAEHYATMQEADDTRDAVPAITRDMRSRIGALAKRLERTT